ncbi:hypothetical protein QAD02_012565 [Eretmocerus hayati]|uniref:Uncharacterized protein n=1 Tax=Eretmocerus hayati TaxID=131215 RepID=A0ACC2P017_9HYME|nr:hypothetical protein QAD02_012565 [Eretmocerus hayati]
MCTNSLSGITRLLQKYEDYPSPTGTAKLGNARKSWWNRGKSLSQTVTHMLDRMFTLEELISSSLFGGPGEESRPRLDQYKINAILNFCHSKYGENSSWRGDFGKLGHAHMKYLRKRKKRLADIRERARLVARDQEGQP